MSIKFPPKNRDIVEVYDYYDEPLLYTFTAGKNGDLHLALLASENETYKIWLVTQVTATRVNEMVCGHTDLRDMFLMAEFCDVWQFYLPRLTPTQVRNRDSFCARRMTRRGDLEEDILPPVGDRLVRRSETGTGSFRRHILQK